MTNVKPKPLFESTLCSRCYGSGRYSYNSMYGSVCFGCGGSGHKLTKRGAAANKFYYELLSKPVKEVQVGESFRATGVTADGRGTYTYWAKVTEIIPDYAGMQQIVNANSEPQNSYCLVATGPQGACHHCYSKDTADVVRIAATAEQKAEARAKALEYQSTLTKQGQPSKRRA